LNDAFFIINLKIQDPYVKFKFLISLIRLKNLIIVILMIVLKDDL